MSGSNESSAKNIEIGFDRRKLGAAFEEVAHAYTIGRPSYPIELIRDLTRSNSTEGHATGSVFEVGAGTGQATHLLAECFADVATIEPSKSMYEELVHRLKTYQNVTIHRSYFEDWEDESQYDCVFSASAFHWTDPQYSYARAARMLRDGGRLVFVTYTELIGDGRWETDVASIAALFTKYWGRPPRFGARSFEEIRAGVDELSGSIGEALEFVEFGKPLETTQCPIRKIFLPAEYRMRRDDRVYTGELMVAALESRGSFRQFEPAIRSQLKTDLKRYVQDSCYNQLTMPFALVGLASQRVEGYPKNDPPLM